jgi:hypothetical protein
VYFDIAVVDVNRPVLKFFSAAMAALRLTSLTLAQNPTASALPLAQSLKSYRLRRLVSRSNQMVDPAGLYLVDPPRRGFFGTLFEVISSVVILGTLFNGITIFWNIVHRQHIRNTLRAQRDIDYEHLVYNSKEWLYKNQIARLRVMIMIAIVNPRLFVKRFVFEEKERSEERKRMAGMLKRFNPKYYDKHCDELGEAATWNESDFIDDDGNAA